MATESEVQRVDKHYDAICKAILNTTGCQVKDLNSHSIYEEHKRSMRTMEDKRMKMANLKKPGKGKGHMITST